MNVGEIFQRDAVVIGSFENLTAAAQLMREKHVGFLVVVEPGFENQLNPIGVLSIDDVLDEMSHEIKNVIGSQNSEPSVERNPLTA